MVILVHLFFIIETVKLFFFNVHTFIGGRLYPGVLSCSVYGFISFCIRSYVSSCSAELSSMLWSSCLR